MTAPPTRGSRAAAPHFPFSAVVGHDDLKLALVLSAVDAGIGGVLIYGEKGSAKTTLARGLASLLPGDAPFVDLPIGSTEDRVVGSIDIRAALTEGDQQFRPGLLHDVDGGVLYVDEVNLLPDHLVDVLLDVAASGVNRVEREGISATHPSRFVLVGSMNPEEGELRPQLLDRFGLAVEVATSTEPAERAEAVRRRLAFDSDPAAFRAAWAAQETELAERLVGLTADGTEGPRKMEVGEDLARKVASLCAELGAEGLRADLVTCRAAGALAAWEGRGTPTLGEVARVAPMALAHRRRRSPLERTGVDSARIDEALERLRGREEAPPSGSPSGDAADGGGPADGSPPGDGPGGAPERRAEPDSGERPVPLPEPGRQPWSAHTGRRASSEATRGRLVGDRAPDGAPGAVAIGATAARAAARRVAERSVGAEASGRLVEAGDVREAVREQRVGALVVLAVDASGSMGAPRRMEAAKAAVMSLLLDAYQRRDRVALVTFRGEGAELVLAPTGSVEVARARLVDLPTGGRTPLAAGITAALAVAESSASRAEGRAPLLVLVSDGRATACPEGEDPLQSAFEAAARVRERGVRSVVVNAEGEAGRLGLARELADAMGADCVSLEAAPLEAVVAAIAR